MATSSSSPADPAPGLRSAVTVCLVPEARSGPFVYHGDLEVACAQAARFGFQAIELFPPGGDALDVRLVRQVLHRSRLELAAVGTGAGKVVHQLTLTSPDPSVRENALRFAASLVDFAGAFGAPAILGSMQGRFDEGVTRGQALGWLAAALEQLGPRAHAYGVPLLLEPLNRYETNLLNTLGQALEFLAPLRTRNVKILADLFHMNIEEARLGEALRTAGAAIAHVHFADSNRQAVGQGHTDVAEVRDALLDIGYRGYLSAEIFPLPSAEQAAQRTITSFRSLLGSS